MNRQWKSALLILASLCLPVGCSSTHPGTGFSKQVDEFKWSATTLVGQDDWYRSLKYDLKELSDPELDQFGESLELLGW